MRQGYCIYLRKSRVDIEAEKRGEMETLARHERALMELAKSKGYPVTEIKKEIVSGESIASRPKMQELLHEVEKEKYDGVIVMEVERLARGNTIDQGIVAQTFQVSNTLIVTPLKTYDPNDEFDEEYFEFGLFMSRREYKTIRRRMEAGRISAVKEGKWVGNKWAYGYDRVKIENDSGYMLKPNADSAVVKLIFDLYTVGEQLPDGTHQRMGAGLIAKKLESMGIPTPSKSGHWSQHTVYDIIKNDSYAGKVLWGRNPYQKVIVDGNVVKKRTYRKQGIVADGLHEAIISEEQFNLAQEIRTSRSCSPLPNRTTLKNPLAGVLVCGKCGRSMVRRPMNNRTKGDTLLCTNYKCDNVGSDLTIVEERLVSMLKESLSDVIVSLGKRQGTESEDTNQLEQILKQMKSELKKLEEQKSRTYDLLEQNVYSVEVFTDRIKVLQKKTDDVSAECRKLEEQLSKKKKGTAEIEQLIPVAVELLEAYDSISSAKEKNEILKLLLNKAEYVKESTTRWHGSPDDFSIVIYPKFVL